MKVAQNNLPKDLNSARQVFENELSLEAIDAVDKHFSGLSSEPFESKVQEILSAPLDPKDVECKPGMIHYVYPLPITIRWDSLPTRDKVSAFVVESIWSWWMGYCPSWTTHDATKNLIS